MARKRERLFAGFFAALFLITSSALAIVVIYTMATQNKKPADSSQQQTQQPKNQLTGTQLPGFAPTSTPLTQLQATDTKPGTGATVKAGDTVTVDYEGAVMSTGKIFDASADHGGPQPLSLSQVIAGWSQGIPGMKVGGTRRLLIPAALAYGPQPPQGSGIPANADLVFDVTVQKIGK
ncbi:MAG TPA: FKBP-type peptidyl-prolyl cis-trans isomerase [Candidatus Saccharimonadales bacterium]|nr:FKBP-type peptidyl-prolyl cis-trans isomerase [Candidatus Saccharimonadales bacterium]